MCRRRCCRCRLREGTNQNIENLHSLLRCRICNERRRCCFCKLRTHVCFPPHKGQTLCNGRRGEKKCCPAAYYSCSWCKAVQWNWLTSGRCWRYLLGAASRCAWLIFTNLGCYVTSSPSSSLALAIKCLRHRLTVIVDRTL